MMKLQIASDLHLEFLTKTLPSERLITPAPDADVLILAGDITVGAEAVEPFADWPVPVLYVAGNHEFYGRDIDDIEAQLRFESEETQVHFLEKDAIVIDLRAKLWRRADLDPRGGLCRSHDHINPPSSFGGGRCVGLWRTLDTG